MRSMYDFYQTEIHSQFPATQWMTEGGFHIDVGALIKLRKKLREETNELGSQISSLVGWTPNVDGPLDMGKLLTQLGVKYRLTKKSKMPKIAKEDLLDYAYQSIGAKRRVLELCLEVRSRKTLQSDFLQLALDGRDYYHPTYRLNGTKSGRFASEGADEGGPQGQNWPGPLLHIVIPDDPKTDELTEADLSQAESMIVAWDAQDLVAIEAFLNGTDSHRLKGCWIFRGWDYWAGIPPTELLNSITTVCPKCAPTGASKCNHSERQVSKKSGYAFTYKMGVRKFVKKILPEEIGVYLTEAEGEEIRKRVVSPLIIKWQNETVEELKRARVLYNLLGRPREFFGRVDNTGTVLRDALSWKAQSVVGVIAGRAIARLEGGKCSLRHIPGARLVTQRHDSVLVSHHARDRGRVYEAIDEAFYSPINAHGRILNIPNEKKSGPNWGELH